MAASWCVGITHLAAAAANCVVPSGTMTKKQTLDLISLTNHTHNFGYKNSCSEPQQHEYSYSSFIMAYGSTPYVGMTPNKNGGHNKSVQMTRSKCL